MALQHECTPGNPPESGKRSFMGQNGSTSRDPGPESTPQDPLRAAFRYGRPRSMSAVDSSMSAPRVLGRRRPKTGKTGPKRVNFQRPGLPGPPGDPPPAAPDALMLLSTASTLFAIPYRKAASQIGRLQGLANKNAFLDFLDLAKKCDF